MNSFISSAFISSETESDLFSFLFCFSISDGSIGSGLITAPHTQPFKINPALIRKAPFQPNSSASHALAGLNYFDNENSS